MIRWTTCRGRAGAAEIAWEDGGARSGGAAEIG